PRADLEVDAVHCDHVAVGLAHPFEADRGSLADGVAGPFVGHSLLYGHPLAAIISRARQAAGRIGARLHSSPASDRNARTARSGGATPSRRRSAGSARPPRSSLPRAGTLARPADATTP